MVPTRYTSDRLRQMRLKAKLRAARVSSKVKRAIMGMGMGGDGDDGGAAWGFDEDAVDVGDDEDSDDDMEFDENG